ncbi:hypothetical protein TNCV_2982061 [Trichonephila clavipes]|nr:hypothetical protein TNCV_2982061 [Trichonephila clavipes]
MMDYTIYNDFRYMDRAQYQAVLDDVLKPFGNLLGGTNSMFQQYNASYNTSKPLQKWFKTEKLMFCYGHSFVNPTPLAHADTSRDVLPRRGTSQLDDIFNKEHRKLHCWTIAKDGSQIAM